MDCDGNSTSLEVDAGTKRIKEGYSINASPPDKIACIMRIGMSSVPPILAGLVKAVFCMRIDRPLKDTQAVMSIQAV